MNYLSNLLIPRLPNKSNYKLNDDEKLGYELSEESYKSPQERKRELNGYTLDYNNDDTVVYKKGKDVIVGFRGTKNSSDIIPDLNVATDSQEYNKRFNDSLNLVKALKVNNNVKLISGSSLGGSISRFVSDKENVNSVTFNAAQSPFTKGKRVRTSRDLVISGDPISKNNGADIVLLPKTKNFHSLENFKSYF